MIVNSIENCDTFDPVEDWDAEIEADHSAGHRVPGAAGKFQVPSPHKTKPNSPYNSSHHLQFGRSSHVDYDGEESVLPQRHQVLKQLTNASVTRVTKFPKPPIM